MVGIGGIGMSGIAEILLQRGYTVTGSDSSRSETTERLEKLGAKSSKGHDAGHIEGADVVVYTSAVKGRGECGDGRGAGGRDPRDQAGRDAGRADAHEIRHRHCRNARQNDHHDHDRTRGAGGSFDPTIIVGGRVHSFDKTNAVVGKGDIVIVEADEFDRTFLRLSPSLAVITNIDIEHMDIYHDEAISRARLSSLPTRCRFTGRWCCAWTIRACRASSRNRAAHHHLRFQSAGAMYVPSISVRVLSRVCLPFCLKKPFSVKSN
jgi:UDP-N-acetylmuramate-alanine ligase